MDIDLSDVISWILVGALVGPLVGWIATGKKEGFGWYKNTGLGLLGALVGGLVWKLLGIHVDALHRISVSAEDLVAAAAGAVVLLLVLRLIKSRKKPAT